MDRYSLIYHSIVVGVDIGYYMKKIVQKHHIIVFLEDIKETLLLPISSYVQCCSFNQLSST